MQMLKSFIHIVFSKKIVTVCLDFIIHMQVIIIQTDNCKWYTYTKEDIGIEQQLYEIVRSKNFALNCLSWKFTEMIMITNSVVIPENFVVVR